MRLYIYVYNVGKVSTNEHLPCFIMKLHVLTYKCMLHSTLAIDSGLFLSSNTLCNL